MSGYGLHTIGSMFVSYPTGFEDASLLGNAAMSIIICNNISEYRTAQRWMDNQYLVLWRGPCSTQRQA